jgi:hypothetical protein
VSQSVNVTDILTRIRDQADIETSDQANSLFTDTRLTDWVNQAYKALYDLICDDTPAAEAHFATSASVGPSAWTLPSDFYRELGIDYQPYGLTVNASYFEFLARNRNNLITVNAPQYRIRNGSIVWSPNNPSVGVTLWYIPTPSTLGSSFNAFNGWDDYVTQWVVRQVKLKQEYPIDEVQMRLGEAERRVRRAAKRVVSYQDSVFDIRGLDDEAFYNA